MKIGITGSTSGLGCALTELLVSKGYSIRALVRKTSKIAHLKDLGIELVYGDINDIKSLYDFIRDIDICYHIAALVGNASKDSFIQTNVIGTENICNAIVQINPLCKLVYCSSMAVLGIKKYNKFMVSNYTISKYKAEKVVERYMKENDLRATIIYPGYIYGRYDRNFLPELVYILKNGLSYLVAGGEKNAPIIYIDDLSDLFYLAGIHDIAVGKKYLGVRGLEIGVHDFIKIIAEEFNFSYPYTKYPRFPMMAAAVIFYLIYKLFKIKSTPPITIRLISFLSAHYKWDDNRAFNELGWNAQTTVKDGLGAAIKYFKNK